MNKSVDWSQLLQNAVSIPGKLPEAYKMFHQYSIGNQVLAADQLIRRGMKLSPIASFSHWNKLGRRVKKGEQALSLIMPVVIKDKKTEEEDEDGKDNKTRVVFMLKKNWFSLDQTEGEPCQPESSLPGWDKDTALQTLGIVEIPFEKVDGNCLGYAMRGTPTIAINPLLKDSWSTMFHEIAHHLLGHTAVFDDGGGRKDLPSHIKELEAEATAYLCCATLGLPGMDESRGYIQNWFAGDKFPERSARRVFAAADKILKAGRPASKASGEVSS